MKLSKEKRIIFLAACFGALFALRVVQFAGQVQELATAIEVKGEDKQPTWLRSRYKGTRHTEEREREVSDGC